VPHSHNDVGWRKTVEEYFYGIKGEMLIELRSNVSSTISTVVEALAENEERRFSEVEMKFFKMWWDE
jgi:hypothetical protein